MKHVALTKRNFTDQPLANYLRQNLAGQDDAIDVLVKAYAKWEYGISAPRRPIANLLFLGPTGTGKTALVEKFTEYLFGEGHLPLKVNCGEFQTGHEIAKLIGSPPGYLGHRETPAYFEPSRVEGKYDKHDRQVQVVLFDEIEKANDALFALLLGIMDRAEVTLGAGQKVSFKNCFIIMTSNLGVEEKVKMQNGFGFAEPERKQKKIAQIATDAAKRKFSPEFWNRLDEKVVFNTLSRQDLETVLDLEMTNLERRLSECSTSRTLHFALSKEARQLLLVDGYDERYNARHLKRSVEKHVADKLAFVLTPMLGRNRRVTIQVGVMDDELSFMVPEMALKEVATAV